MLTFRFQRRYIEIHVDLINFCIKVSRKVFVLSPDVISVDIRHKNEHNFGFQTCHAWVNSGKHTHQINVGSLYWKQCMVVSKTRTTCGILYMKHINRTIAFNFHWQHFGESKCCGSGIPIRWCFCLSDACHFIYLESWLFDSWSGLIPRCRDKNFDFEPAVQIPVQSIMWFILIWIIAWFSSVFFFFIRICT